MTAAPSIDPARFLHEQLAEASLDLLRQMLSTFIAALMSAEVDVVCGARTDSERTNSGNGYRHRDFDHPRGHGRRGEPQSAFGHVPSRTGWWKAESGAP